MQEENSLKKSKVNRFLKTYGGCYLFLIPAFIGFFVFTVYPVLYSFFLSFTDFNGVYMTKIGMFNYAQLFSDSVTNGWYTFSRSYLATFEYVLIALPTSNILSFCVSLLLHSNIKGRSFFRTVFYLPALIPGVAMALFSADLFSSNGIVNAILQTVGLPKNTFYLDPATALPTYIISGWFGIGGTTIMWLAAFNNVPPTMIEAARLDGAGSARVLFQIVIPMCTPIIFYNLINGLIGFLQVFDSYAAVGTGPENSMRFVCVLIYGVSFLEYDMGLGCAIAWTLFIIVAILTAIAFKMSGTWVYYGEDEA